MRDVQGHILIVGYGTRGRQWYDACRRNRELELAGVVDTDPLAQEAARKAGLRAWNTIDEAHESTDLDGAIICSPPSEHVGQSLVCIRLGLSVLVEKPLALSVDEAVVLADESSRLGVPVLVGQNFRFLARERAVRKALAAGFGLPLRTVIVSARPSSVAAAHLATIDRGAVWDICLHHLDALRIRYGAVPASAEMTISKLGEPDPSARECFRIVLTWPEGQSVVYEHSEGAPGFYHHEWIEGARQAIIVRDQRVSTLFPHQRARRVSVPSGPTPEQALLGEWRSAMASRTAGPLGVNDNLSTIATVEAAVRSAALGEPTSPAAIAVAAGVELAG